MAERKYYRDIYQKKISPSGKNFSNRLKRFKFRFALKLLGGLFFLLILSLLFLFIYYASQLPRPEKFTERPFIQSTKIYDRTGEILLYDIYGEEKRTLVPLNQISEYLQLAAVAAEDVNFWNHFGLDLKGIVRAVLANLKLRKAVQGASTISQQLIRSSFLTREKTAERKIKEIILTLELERRYPKQQILEFYLNQIPFGSNAYGAEAASQTYFNKSAGNLSLAEAAVLAALIQAPSRLSPYGPNKDDLIIRQRYILDRMAELGFITKEKSDEAKEEDVRFAKILQPIKAPHFVMYVKQQLEEQYGEEYLDYLKEKGLKIYTTLNWELQKEAEIIVKEGTEINKKYGGWNSSLAAINPNTGEILTMVGSADWFAHPLPEGCLPGENCLFEPEVNVAVFGEGRPPGSAFKPFAYAAAFRKGYTAETVLWDVPTEFNPNCDPNGTQKKDKYGLDCYHPQNYLGRFKGPISLRDALAQSVNIPSVKILYLAGIETTISLAKSFGITTLNRSLSWYGLSLVLGGGEVKLLDMVSSYGVFASRGLKMPAISILKIEDSQGNIIMENEKTPKRVLESRVADLINDILSDNEARTAVFGPRSQLYFNDYAVAAKTGTTQDYKDGWTIGYTPSIVVGVWVGNNNNQPMNREPGVVLAGPIWHKFMEKALKLYPKEDFEKPNYALPEKPILRGEVDLKNPHSILYYVDKDDPLGPAPTDPWTDPQYKLWEARI